MLHSVTSLDDFALFFYSALLCSNFSFFLLFFFFNDTATTEIYTLSLHDALPIYRPERRAGVARRRRAGAPRADASARSEEHTSELQSLAYLVCRLLLEKKKKKMKKHIVQS